LTGKPTMNNEALRMKHAADTANEYMLAAIRCIDAKFGDGYAQKHPELIAAFMTTAAQDYHAVQLGLSLDGVISSLDKIPAFNPTSMK